MFTKRGTYAIFNTMLRILFLFLYLCSGVFLLFQASKLAGTVAERVIRQKIPVVEEYRPDEAELVYEDTLRYDATLSLSPLFSAREVQSVSSPRDKDTVVQDSPLLRRYELNGVIVLPKNRSIALIRKSGERESTIYHIGDMLEEMEVIRIEQKEVHLRSKGETVVLPMYYKYTAKQGPRPAAPPVREELSGEYDSARKVQKVLSRSDVEDRVFSKVNEILTQIAISPYMVNGTMEGLRLVRIPKGNIVYELGGRSGDLVKRVNGHELNQIDQMYKLWENIKDDSRITVDLERNNQIFSFDFEIRE